MTDETQEQTETTEEVVDQQPEITEDMDLDIIAKAEDAAARIEAGVAKMETMVTRLQKMKVEGIMSGKTETNVKQQEETAAEYAKKVLANEK